MKRNRQIILDYLNQHKVNAKASEGESAEAISVHLNIHRSNVSRELNELVREGLLEKRPGRPVRYRLMKKADGPAERSSFSALIGHDMSLKNSVQYAKAAILYPQGCMRTMIVGPPGSGKSYFAQAMVSFAKEQGVVPAQPIAAIINCEHYAGDEQGLYEALLGEGLEKNPTHVIQIEHIEAMPTSIRTQFLERLNSQGNDSKTLFIGTCDIGAYMHRMSMFYDYFPIVIQLNSYKDKSIAERLLLLQHFFAMEAASMNKELHLNAELLHSFLIYDCAGNVKQLQKDVRIGTAKAFIRELDRDNRAITLTMSDFPEYVRKGLLNYKIYRSELQVLIPEKYKYIFSGVDLPDGMEKELLEQQNENGSIYDIVNRKVSDLRERGVDPSDITMIINADMEAYFKKYQQQLSGQVVDIEELSKIVNEKLIRLTSDFLEEVSEKCKRAFPETVLYGLCLHLHNTVLKGQGNQLPQNAKILDMVQRYPDEYSFATTFAARIEEEYHIQLPLSEVVFITLFLCEDYYANQFSSRPVVLIAMHGDNAAASISMTVNKYLKESIAYGFDLELDRQAPEAYEALKEKMTTINRGEGIVFVYDTESLKSMGEMASEETGIKLEFVEAPISMLAIECGHSCLMSKSLEEFREHFSAPRAAPDYDIPEQNGQTAVKVILTLCKTGQGGAEQMKQYIESELKDPAVIVKAMAVTGRDELLQEFNQIRKEHEVCCIVGTFEPRLYPRVPFVSISQLFETQKTKLRKLLRLNHEDYLKHNGFYEYLSSSLYDVDIKDIRRLLPDVIARLELLIDEDFTQDQTIGLFMHLACSINRSCAKLEPIINQNTAWIHMQFPELFAQVKKEMNVLEKKFRIRFSDDEAATILSYMKRI